MSDHTFYQRIDALLDQLVALDRENERLREENARLRHTAAPVPAEGAAASPSPVA